MKLTGKDVTLIANALRGYAQDTRDKIEAIPEGERGGFERMLDGLASDSARLDELADELEGLEGEEVKLHVAHAPRCFV